MFDISGIPRVATDQVQFINLMSQFETVSRTINGDDLSSNILFRASAIIPDPNTGIAMTAQSELGNFCLIIPEGLVNEISNVLLNGWEEEELDFFFNFCRAIYAITQLILDSSLADFDWKFEPYDFNENDDLVWQGYDVLINELSYNTSIGFYPEPMSEAMLALQVSQPRQRNVDVPFQINFDLRSADFEICEVRRLRSGDVVFLDLNHDQDFESMMRYRRHAFFESLITSNGSVVISKILVGSDEMDNMNTLDNEMEHPSDGDFEPGQMSSEPEVIGSDISQGAMVGTPSSMPLDLANVKVRLDFCIGTREFAFDELESLTVGSVLDTNLDLSAPVVISANGRYVGVGHLIQVGDVIGVRIDDLPADYGSEDA